MERCVAYHITISDSHIYMAPRYIKITSNDGFVFVVPREAALVSETWRRMLSSESYIESETGELYLDHSAEILSYIIDYLFYNLNYKDTVGQTDKEFKIPPELALQVLVAADYLNV